MDILVIGGGIFLGARVVESALAGGHRLTVFNRGRARALWPEVLATCRSAATQRGVEPAKAVAIDESFLLGEGVEPWSELPLWLPSTDATHYGFSRVDVAKAVAAGLRTRPLRETVAAVLDEGLPETTDPRRLGKLSRRREAAIIAGWRGLEGAAPKPPVDSSTA